MDFQIKRDDLHECRLADTEPAELGPDQALLRIEAFGLTSNNITYAVLGEEMSYWRFFPAEEGWGHMPVWGFAEVTATTLDEVEEGTRVYGYFPPATQLVVSPSRVDSQGFVDAAEHRAELPAVYNSYARVDADPIYDADHEDEQMLFRPLFLTSFLIDDFLDDNDLFGADAVVLSSASSKTALSAAFLLAQRGGVEVTGLTSPRSVDFVEGLGVYDRVVPYDDVASLPRARAAYVDMSGDAEVRDAVHHHFRDELAHSSVVGATHHDQMGEVPDALPGPRPTLFFAPDRVRERIKDWGRDGLSDRAAAAFHPFVDWTAGWLKVEHDSGPEAVERVYRDLLDGRIDPAVGNVLSPAD